MKMFKNKAILASMLLIITCLVQAQGGVQLYGVDNDSDTDALYTIDQTTGVITSVGNLTSGGGLVEGALAMALDTEDNKTVYIVYFEGGSTGERDLGTINLSTAEITGIGPLSDQVAGIAFDDSGQMYAITGNGGMQGETLFSVDKATGAMTLIVAMGGIGNDGEALGFNFDDGLLYRRSGNGDGMNELTSIDPGNPVPNHVLVTSADFSGEATGLLYDIDSGLFLESDRNVNLATVDPTTAVKSVFGNDPNNNYLRGLIFFPSKQDLIFYDGFETSPPPPVR